MGEVGVHETYGGKVELNLFFHFQVGINQISLLRSTSL